MFLCAFQFLALPNKATAGHVVVESCDTFECQNTCSLKGDDFSLITQRKLVFSRASYISSSSGWIHFVVVSLALWEWNKGDQRCSEEMTDTCWWWQQAWSGINVISLVAIGLWTTGIDRSNRQHLLFFFFFFPGVFVAHFYLGSLFLLLLLLPFSFYYALPNGQETLS